MVIRIPNLAPRVTQDPQRTPQAEAARVVPFQSTQAEQLQQFGQSLQGAGLGLQRAGDYLQDQRNDAVALTHKNSYRERVAKLETRASTLEGLNALRELPNIEKELASLRDEYADKFENKVQEQMFSDFANEREADARIRLDVMKQRQTQAANIGALDASVKGEIADYQNNWQDPEAAALHRAGVLESVRKKGRLEGAGREQLQQAELVALTEMHSGVLDSLRGDPAAMQRYFDENRGEMTPDAKIRATDAITRAAKVKQAETIDSAAWYAASNLSRSGASITEQNEAIDMAVRTKRMSAEVAIKTRALVNNFNDQKWQELQRERTSMRQQLEQDFGKNPNLGVDMLPAEVSDKIDRLGLRGEVNQIHTDVRLRRLADEVGEGSRESLVLSRDMRSLAEMSRMREQLQTLASSLVGKDAETPAAKEKKKRIEQMILKLDSDYEALVLRPRTYVTRDDLPSPMPNAPGGTAPAPIDMKKFTEDVRKALYPSSGR